MAELSSEHSAEVDWIVHRVKGQHFLKSRTVQIGDTVLTSKKSNIRNTDMNNSNDQLPRSWTRLLSSFIKLRQLNASSNQISHYLHFQIRSLFDDEARHFLHLLENGKFGRFHRNFMQSDIRLIRDYLQNEIHCRCNAQIDRFKSCADSSNRKRDKKRTECELFLAELGSKECNIHFFNAADRSQLIAVNYERVVYGDHGPYIEFDADEIEWSAFAVSDAPSKGDSVAYYDEYFNVGKQKNVKLYAQKKTVCDQPNPPKGKYAQNHNRSQGYADYKVGFFYISPDHLCVDLSDNKICPYLYLLSNKNQNKQQRNYQKNDNQQPEMRSVYNPKILNIAMLKAPKINTREGERVMNACMNGTYIDGLLYFPNFISKSEELQIREQLIEKSDIWKFCEIQKKRRSLQFGWKLDYESMELYEAKEKGLECVPNEWQWIGQRIQSLMEKKLNTKCKEFNQLILNEYAPNQGISDHTDRTHCFGPIIAGLSLFSCCVIHFTDKRSKNKNESKPVLLEPRSLFVMTGPSRYEYTHRIEDNKEHKFCGQRIRRGVRYSMTFRHAIQNSSEVLTRSSYNIVSAEAMKPL